MKSVAVSLDLAGLNASDHRLLALELDYSDKFAGIVVEVLTADPNWRRREQAVFNFRFGDTDRTQQFPILQIDTHACRGQKNGGTAVPPFSRAALGAGAYPSSLKACRARP